MEIKEREEGKTGTEVGKAVVHYHRVALLILHSKQQELFYIRIYSGELVKELILSR